MNSNLEDRIREMEGALNDLWDFLQEIHDDLGQYCGQDCPLNQEMCRRCRVDGVVYDLYQKLRTRP